MKKLLNPELAQKKIIVIEDSSSQEELEENEGLDVKEMKGKKHVISKDMSTLTEPKISEMLKEVQIFVQGEAFSYYSELSFRNSYLF